LSEFILPVVLKTLLEFTIRTVVAITHDRYFLDNVAGWILELDRGRGIPWEGNYSSWLEQKNKRLAVEEKQAGAHARTLARELDWIKMSPRARQAKGKARINAYEDLMREGVDRAPEKVEIAIPIPQRLGDVVVEAHALRKAFGDKLLFEDLEFKLPPGGIVGIIGANGAGKTTLFKIISGEEKADSGELRLGTGTLDFPQNRVFYLVLVDGLDWLRAHLRRRRAAEKSPPHAPRAT
jgi:ATPase subunit of ABC transporter with duplicated ATPase domains